MNQQNAKKDDPSQAPESGDATARKYHPQSSGDPTSDDRSTQKTGEAPESGTRDDTARR